MFFVNHVKVIKDEDAKLKIFSPTMYANLEDAKGALEKIAKSYIDVFPSPLFSDHCVSMIQTSDFDLYADTVDHPHGFLLKTYSDGSCKDVWYITDGTVEDDDWEITCDISYRPIIDIDKVIFNDPATIVYWDDGSKTVVKCMDGDTFNKETGLAMAIAKRYMGNDGTHNKVMREWLNETES